MPDETPDRESAPWTRDPRLRAAAWAFAALLLIAAAWWAIASGRDALATALSVGRTRPWLLVLALVLPVANWLLISGVLWALTVGRDGPPTPRVPYAEMSALVGSAWLLNYLPLRPGLIGRVAYHKRRHGLALRDTALALGGSIGCAAASIAALLGSVALAPTLGDAVALLPLAGLVAIPRAASRGGRPARWAAAFSLRYADLLVWAARYAVVFELVGEPLSLGQAGAIAAVGQAAMLVPLVGNGLGVREWAVAVAGPALPTWAAGAALTRLASLTAELINRAAEVAVAVPVGLLSMAWLARRWPRHEAGAEVAGEGTHAALNRVHDDSRSRTRPRPQADPSPARSRME